MKQILEKYGGLGRLATANLINNSVTFLCLIFLSKLIAPEQYGVFILCVSILMTTAGLLDFGTNLSFIRWYNLKEKSIEKNVLYSAAVLIRLSSTAVILLLSVPIAHMVKFLVMRDTGSWIDIAAAVITAIIFGWWTLVRAIRQAQQNYKRYSLLTVIFAVARIFAVLGLYFYGIVDPIFFLIGLYLIPPFLLVIFDATAELPKIFSIQPLSEASRRTARLFVSYGKWPFASMVMYPLVTNIPVWVMGNMNDFVGAGTYGVGIVFANALAPMREAIRVFMFPKVVGLESNAQARALLERLRRGFVYIPVIALAASIVTVGAQKLIHGKSYENAYLIIILLVSTHVATMYTNIIGAILHYLGRPQLDTFVNIFRVAMSLGLSILLIPRYGAVGGAVAASISIVTGEYFIYRYIRKQLTP